MRQKLQLCRSTIVLILILIIQTNTFGQEIEINKNTYQAMWDISSKECLDHVEILSSRKFSGRGTGDEEFKLTANYIAKQFEEMGLSPLSNDSSFFQMFNISRNKIGGNNSLSMEVLIKAKKEKDTLSVHYDLEKDFLPTGFSSPCNLKTEIVVPGFGIISEKNNWNDYLKINVTGKAVMVLGGTPSIENADWGQARRMRSKVDFAIKNGATAFIFIGGPIGLVSTQQKIPSIMLSEKAANDLLKGTGYSVKSLREEINKKKKSIGLKLKHKIHLKIESKLHPNCETMNIVGFLPGSDPVLKDEYIILGAHADHLGIIGNMVFTGANDNASGTAAVVEIAEAFCKLKQRPRRSLVFIAFTGEEMGLLGSKYYTENPLAPLNKTKAMINLDMVGSGRKGMMIVGGHTFPDFAKLFDKHNNLLPYGEIKRRWTSNNSDHYPFHEKNIPAVFLYAFHGQPTYHLPTDLPETVDAEVMESVSRLVFRTMWEMANMDFIQLKEVKQK